MSVNGNQKGKRRERELAALLKTFGFEARRGVQYSGSSDSPDVVGIPGWHIECKGTETFAPYAALDQSIRDSAGTAKPIVFHKSDGRTGKDTVRGSWTVFLKADDFLKIIKGDEHGPGSPSEG